VPVRLSALEVAERAGCPEALVGRLVELGIVARGKDGLFNPTDAHLVRLMNAFEESGISLDDVARGFASGELTYSGMGAFFAEPEPFVSTYGELAISIGRPFERVAGLVSAFGFPRPHADDRVRADEARLIERFLAVWEVAEDDELLQFARVRGDAMRLLAEGGLAFYDRAVNRRLLAAEGPPAELVAQARRIGERGAVVARELVTWLYERHFERELVRFSTDATEAYLDRLGIAPARERTPPAIAFLDLAGYTALTEEEGDEAAATLAATLATVVGETARAHGGEAVKWLGDGVMLHFPEAVGGVLASLDLVERVPETVAVPARSGLHAGPVVFQDGDYFGRTVNVAARIADYARPGEVLVSAEARDAAPADEVEFREIGPVALKGLRESVRLFAASRHA
jgi:adenylate cyclase